MSIMEQYERPFQQDNDENVIVRRSVVSQKTETILEKIVHSASLPRHGATIDALRAVCADPSKENIAMALCIADRAELILEHKADEVRRKLEII